MHNQSLARIGLIGASGYSGIEATRLLAGHPHVQLSFLASDRWDGETTAARIGLDTPLRYVTPKAAEARFLDCDAVLFATPAEVSLELVPKALEAGARVIDLSGAFRLKDPALYPRFYGFPHAAPKLLAEAVYGLPELFRSRLAGARFIANPGCYPTAAALALAPLVRGRCVDPRSVVVSAASGVTGAGRKASEEYSFTELDGDFRAYKVLGHQHTPEMAQTLGLPELTFTPHLLPIKRGILSTAFARVLPGVTAEQVASAYSSTYANEPFVRLLDAPEAVNLKSVVGTNRCALGHRVEGERVVVVSAIDNLVKGAAGQAVQNLNLLFGWEETTGLSAARGLYP